MDYKLVKFPTLQKRDDKAVIKPIFSDDVLVIVAGKPKDGKSTLISRMIRHNDLLGKKYDMVLCIMPGDLPYIDRDEEFWTDTLDFDWLKSRFDIMQDKCSNRNDKPGRLLIVFDDMITTLERSGKHKEFEEMVFRRRWLIPNCSISMIFTAQYLSLVPKKYRTCATHFITFGLLPSDLELFLKNYSWAKDSMKKDLIKTHLKTRHNFLCIHVDDTVVFLNFDTIID